MDLHTWVNKHCTLGLLHTQMFCSSTLTLCMSRSVSSGRKFPLTTWQWCPYNSDPPWRKCTWLSEEMVDGTPILFLHVLPETHSWLIKGLSMTLLTVHLAQQLYVPALNQQKWMWTRSKCAPCAFDHALRSLKQSLWSCSRVLFVLIGSCLFKCSWLNVAAFKHALDSAVPP